MELGATAAGSSGSLKPVDTDPLSQLAGAVWLLSLFLFGILLST